MLFEPDNIESDARFKLFRVVLVVCESSSESRFAVAVLREQRSYNELVKKEDDIQNDLNQGVARILPIVFI